MTFLSRSLSHTHILQTFPGDKENRVHPLPASATPSPLKLSSATHTTHTTTADDGGTLADQRGKVLGEMGNREVGVAGEGTAVRRKRKVLR